MREITVKVLLTIILKHFHAIKLCDDEILVNDVILRHEVHSYHNAVYWPRSFAP